MAETSIFSNLQRRNLGQTGLPLTFQHSAASSLDLVKRLELKAVLEGHTGCVNTVSFSEAGDLLVSGSDDKRIMLWNFYTGRLLAWPCTSAPTRCKANIAAIQ